MMITKRFTSMFRTLQQPLSPRLSSIRKAPPPWQRRPMVSFASRGAAHSNTNGMLIHRGGSVYRSNRTALPEPARPTSCTKCTAPSCASRVRALDGQRKKGMRCHGPPQWKMHRPHPSHHHRQAARPAGSCHSMRKHVVVCYPCAAAITSHPSRRFREGRE